MNSRHNPSGNRAALIAVGSELLSLGRVDTNGVWITERLQRLGIDVRMRTIVDDDEVRIAQALRAGVEHADVLVVTGGLGPTDDDRTRESLAAAFGLELTRDEALVERLRGRFAERGYPFHDEQARQADKPASAEWLRNRVGVAPGVYLEHEATRIALLPGVPAEMKSIWEEELAPRLTGLAGVARRTATLRVAGRTESSVDREIGDLYEAEGLEITLLAGAGELTVHLIARGAADEVAAQRLASAKQRLTQRLGADLFGEDDASLAGAAGRLLAESGLDLAVAESCTGGLLGGALTAVPGSSAWFKGGVIAYSNELKVLLAGVDPDLLAAHGAVSEEVARGLASGVRARAGADLGIGITGVAGPGGGTAEKPVGLVHLALSGGGEEEAWHLNLPGDRDAVRRRAVFSALDRLRRRLLQR
ncbi:hypothetical protein ABI59_03945 [Acidobacteria bacterium Mor1]|nr:hypothetical protein ABI59_03945 [Acidobacteria bacterium Mor1]